MWLKYTLLVVGTLTICFGLAVTCGTLRWEHDTRKLRARLEAARLRIRPRTFDVRELDGLPAPVQRYFRIALEDGQPLVAAASMEHVGTFNMRPTLELWRPFTSTQRVVTRRPGFYWDACIVMIPGLPVRVHDAYVAGEGILHAALLGLVTLASVRGVSGPAEGELMRFFAEAVWYPTALLPSQGVSWEAADETSATATMSDGEVIVTLLFRFNDAGLIDSVRADTRGRVIKGVMVQTPWECRLWRYELRHGMHVPTEAEAAWVLAEGPRPYWRGRITTLGYEFENEPDHHESAVVA